MSYYEELRKAVHKAMSPDATYWDSCKVQEILMDEALRRQRQFKLKIEAIKSGHSAGAK